MYEKRRKGRKRRKRKKEISRATSIITNTHAHPPYLLTHPLYIYIIYIILNLVLFCALYIAVCQLRSQLQVFFKLPYFSILSYPLSATPTNSILDPLHLPSPRLRNLSRHTRHTLTYKSATHETRHQRYGRPIARRRFSRWINSFSSRWLFFAPFFPTTFAAPLTNDYCLSEIRTATIFPTGCLLLSTEVQRTSRSQHPSSFFSTLSPAPSSAFSFLSLKHGVSYFR